MKKNKHSIPGTLDIFDILDVCADKSRVCRQYIDGKGMIITHSKQRRRKYYCPGS